MSHVLCWGDVGWDVYAGRPAPLPGGCALNVATALRAAGAEVAVGGALGPDGAPLRRYLQRLGVDTAALLELEGPTPRQELRVLADGEREFAEYRPGVLLRYDPGAALDPIRACRLLYVPVFDHTLPWVRWVLEQAPHTRLALDLMNLSDVDPAFMELAVDRAAYVFAGLHAERQAAEVERLAGFARRTGAATVVTTLGPRGASAHTREGRLDLPAPPVPGGVVDTTGCGDAVAGTFLAHAERGAPLPAALGAALERAARVAGHLGAVGPLEPEAEEG
ncbi:MAG: carbohydrate kinase family protein [Planctomycetes bacterium]|nr:carbohydrate kinase family protein [Planctomycetota bacterium]